MWMDEHRFAKLAGRQHEPDESLYAGLMRMFCFAGRVDTKHNAEKLAADHQSGNDFDGPQRCVGGVGNVHPRQDATAQVVDHGFV